MAIQSAHLLNALLRVTAFLRRSSRLRRMARRFRGWPVLALLGRPPASEEVAAQFRRMVALAAQAEPAVVSVAPQGAAPLISFVVPVFNTRPAYLDDLLASFREQRAGLCELVLSDDGSTATPTSEWLDSRVGETGVIILRNAQNRGIAAATNAGIARAAGAWIGLLDHDDRLAPFAASRIVEALAKAPQCRFLYTDELIVDAKLRPVEFFLKPAWDPVLLSGVNYINHLCLYRRDRLQEIGGLREGFQGSQDYDLVLRYTTALSRSEILHLPYPAYVWRHHGSSHSTVFLETATQNARRALAEHYQKEGRAPVIERALSPFLHRIRFDREISEWPLVSVVIVNHDGFSSISKVLSGLISGTDYPALQIIVVDLGSKDPRVLALYEASARARAPFVVLAESGSASAAQAINRGVASSHGLYVLLLGADIEIREPGWLKEMVSCFAYPDVGAAGAKLLRPDLRIHHAGIIPGLRDGSDGQGPAGHWFAGRPEDFPGPMGRLLVRQSLSAVAGACMLISRECLERTGGLGETSAPGADLGAAFCLRAGAAGYRIVWTPFATLLRHAARPAESTPTTIDAAPRSAGASEDPAFNPWYSTDRSEPVAVSLDRLPEAR
jgi:GT2 family glycosyltransferase